MEKIKIIKSDEIIKTSTSHDKNIYKNVIISNNTIPHIFQFAFTIFKKGDKIEIHSHPSAYEVFYIEYGKITLLTEDERIILTDNDSFIVPPNCIHGLEILEETKIIYFLSSSK
ncbi:MAG TPA: cupin domain-containing protein [Ignavibacteriales bacterium]|nr:cupin domain-containing protein [Ignavibacteriales bacterium]HOL81963.1 cupin domain-containing protein [Ignavibacteriales bacterium]HOM64993.1 cupin domain-containing protein [Ignavibacteriales bacterium]HPP34100.1 cupin domain-containing protein [Ignavibacteriales bacterium]HRR17786.1 cupin domain-containing protein [Ignavibacteriales bacterium]